ncbi:MULTISPECIES: hypothetical protein [Streptomyces]|uniref:Secreted protein n=1 Tax=Streptomyces sudanensis TaxID=436397 RepID=A0ABY4TL24_9ACTN|nr:MULTISPECIES: hypothetical protein [Streptomyces]MCP9960070.1 hypothetical protein [Streptomyces sudanensis]MCP9999534.1 hypothetical protein [Streptomyces sudanensis]URN18398.1 hypothetical protein MW084_23350 [Streptomyces sudanensis]
MKKRSMLAVASLAAGVVTSLLTPSSHAAVGSGLPEAGTMVGADDVTALVDGVTGKASQGLAPHTAGETVRH